MGTFSYSQGPKPSPWGKVPRNEAEEGTAVADFELGSVIGGAVPSIPPSGYFPPGGKHASEEPGFPQQRGSLSDRGGQAAASNILPMKIP